MHDVIEDTECTKGIIAQEFNPRIAEIAFRLSRIVEIDAKKVKLTTDQLMKSLEAVDDQESLLIKELDRLHNLSTLSHISKKKQTETAAETLKSIVSNIAYSVDKLNIDNKHALEDEIFEQCQKILKSSKEY